MQCTVTACIQFGYRFYTLGDTINTVYATLFSKDAPFIAKYFGSMEPSSRNIQGVPGGMCQTSEGYGKVYRYNPKHLCPKLNGYGDNGQRKVWSSGGSMHYSYQLTCYQCLSLTVAWYYVSAVNCMGFLQGTLRMHCEWSVSCAELLKCL
jgi:hypothetical protein